MQGDDKAIRFVYKHLNMKVPVLPNVTNAKFSHLGNTSWEEYRRS